MKLYGVVTMDLSGSRKINNREALQEKLRRHFSLMNEKYADSLVSSINFTLGDEWQLITNNPKECYNIVHDFQRLLWEDDLNFYAGIGIGELKTGIYDDTRMMDGSCFIMAREAINIVKSLKKTPKFIYSKANKVFFRSVINEVIMSSTSNKNVSGKGYGSDALSEVAMDIDPPLVYLDDIINIIIENNEILKSRLTDKQKEIYLDYMNYKSYRKIIEENKERSKETPGGISQKLNNAEYFTIQRNHEMIVLMVENAVTKAERSLGII